MAEGGGDAKAGGGTPPVFISYASQDAAVADAVVGALERAGLKCWIAPRDVVPGALYADEIVRAINEAKVVVLILSEAAAASPHVGKEIERASSKRRRIVAIRTDAASLPRSFEYFLSESQWIDVGSGGIEAAAARLVDAVRRHVAPPSVTESNIPIASHTRDRKATTPQRRWVFVASGIVFAVALAYFLRDKFWLSKQVTAGQQTTVVTAVVGDKSIAVLPFVDLSEKHDQEYFADAMAEEVIDLLAKIPGLRVIGRTSSFQFRGKSLDARTIGTTLKVSYMLEGSVRRAGDQVRVTAQLISAQDGSHRSSDTYDSKTDDVLRVQETIAAGISRALELTMSGAVAEGRSITSADAYDLYMRGLHALDSTSNEGCEQAIDLFNGLLRLQPNSERALISLGWAHDCLGWGSWDVPGAGFPQASDFARRALKVDPKSSEAHLIIANAYIGHEFDWLSAQREIDAAFKLDGRDVRGLRTAARLAQALGQFDRAIDLLNQALARIL